MKDGKNQCCHNPQIAKQVYLWEIKYFLKYFEVNMNENIIISNMLGFH